MRDYQSKSNVGGIADSITPEKLGAGEANSFLTEMKTAVSSSGQALAPADGTGETTDQLARAAALYGAGGGQSCRDTGTANNFVLDPFGSFKAIPGYFDGMLLTFSPATDNTGACTLNYNSLGVRGLRKPGGVVLKPGELSAGRPIIVQYNETAGYFELISESQYTTGVQYTIGATGDYASINEALEDVTRYEAVYKKAGTVIILELQAGFVMAEQVLVSGRNLGWIKIEGVDAETTIDHTALTVAFDGDNPAFGVNGGGTLPIINQLFTMSSGAGAGKHGVQVKQTGSTGIVLPGGGVKDAGGNGCYVVSGEFYGISSNFSGAAGNGIEAAFGAIVSADSCDIKNSGDNGAFIHRGSKASLQNCIAPDAVANGIRAQDASSVDAEGADVFSAGVYGIFSGNASVVHAGLIDANNAGTLCLYAENGSIINAGGAKLTGLGAFDVDIDDLSFIDISNLVSGGTFSGTLNAYTAKGCVAQ